MTKLLKPAIAGAVLLCLACGGNKAAPKPVAGVPGEAFAPLTETDVARFARALPAVVSYLHMRGGPEGQLRVRDDAGKVLAHGIEWVAHYPTPDEHSRHHQDGADSKLGGEIDHGPDDRDSLVSNLRVAAGDGVFPEQERADAADLQSRLTGGFPYPPNVLFVGNQGEVPGLFEVQLDPVKAVLLRQQDALFRVQPGIECPPVD